MEHQLFAVLQNFTWQCCGYYKNYIAVLPKNLFYGTPLRVPKLICIQHYFSSQYGNPVFTQVAVPRAVVARVCEVRCRLPGSDPSGADSEPKGYTELHQKAIPRLREFASTAGGGIAQPRNNLVVGL